MPQVKIGSSVKTRFVVGAILMLVPLLVVGAASILLLRSTERSADDVRGRAAEGVDRVARLREAVLEAERARVYQGVLAGETPSAATLTQADAAVERAFLLAQRADVLDGQRNLLRAARHQWSEVRAIGVDTAAPSDLLALRAATRRLELALDGVAEAAREELADASESVRRTNERARVLALLVLVTGFGVAVVAGVRLAGSIVAPLGALEAAARRLGSGDLAARAELPAAASELTWVAAAFNDMARSIAAHQAQLQELTLRDPLTGLYNRRAFLSRLDEEVERGRRYAVAFSVALIDLDHFKHINDTHGHAAGDAVLVRVAAIVTRSLRPMDLVARFGGEELALILPATPSRAAALAVERIRAALDESSVEWQGERIVVTASAGVASFPEHADNPEHLVSLADLALYDAKATGRNRVVVADVEALR